jgi:uncharacterized membrane protein YczE
VSRGARLVRLFLGFDIIAIGVALNVRSELGLGPLFVVFDGLHERLGITIGTASIITNAALFVWALAMRERPGLGTLGQVFIVGPLIDLALWLTPEVTSPGLRVAYLVGSLVVLSFGAALYLSADLGAGPYDAVMWGLFRRLRRLPLSGVRVIMETTALLTGWSLGGEVGIGTVIIGLGIGPGIAIGLRLLGAMPERTPTVVAARK